MTNKQEALKAIEELPDTVGYEEMIYRLYVLEQIHAGQKDIDEGRITSVDELEKEIRDWT